MRIVTLAAVAALAGASATAQEIGAWDTNSDGLLEEAEFTEGFLSAGVFGRWDLDGDDLIGFSELSGGLYGLWDADEDGELSVDEWDDAVDLWFGEQDVNLSEEAWDENGDGIISQAEFAEGLQRTDLLARLDTVDDDSLLGEEEFASGLFDVADADEDDQLGEGEDGLLGEIADFLVPASDQEEPAAEEGVLDDEEAIGDEEGPFEDGDEDVLEEDEPLVEFDEAFMQLPIPCGSENSSCEQVAQRFCEALGYGEPIAFLDVEGSLYVIRCEDEI